MDTADRLAKAILELRKPLLHLGAAVLVATGALYFLSSRLLALLQDHLQQPLAFFRVAEPFLAHVKLAFFGALFLLMPWITAVLWRGVSKPFGLSGASRRWFVFFTCCLFYAGVLFCYLVTLPFGVKFLLGFQSQELRPVISVGRFVNFVTIFILGFGVIFELPIFMVFVAKVGICPRSSFERHRRYAVLVISIVAALLTPTPDVVNMALMGVPLYLLYEAGIWVLKVMKIC